MKHRILFAAALAVSALSAPTAFAEGAISSVYSKLDFDNACIALPSGEAEAAFSCPGHGGYGVRYTEGDLRQSVFFGHLGPWFAQGAWESFGPFNYVNDTVEWRLRDGVPFATILRWFIENPNSETGAPDEAHRGQVLVVSKVGQPGVGDACAVGYVDALANADANELARQIADTVTDGFACRADVPQFHGARGPLVSDPVRVFAE